MSQVAQYDRRYVQDHVSRYKAAMMPGGGNAAMERALDSLWRIASNADLFPVDVLQSGLSEAQYSEILIWLRVEGFNV